MGQRPWDQDQDQERLEAHSHLTMSMERACLVSLRCDEVIDHAQTHHEWTQNHLVAQRVVWYEVDVYVP